MEQSEEAKPENVGAVRADPVLDQRRLLSLHPGMKSREVQDGEENDPCQHDFMTRTSIMAPSLSSLSGSVLAPCSPIVS